MDRPTAVEEEVRLEVVAGMNEQRNFGAEGNLEIGAAAAAAGEAVAAANSVAAVDHIQLPVMYTLEEHN